MFLIPPRLPALASTLCILPFCVLNLARRYLFIHLLIFLFDIVFDELGGCNLWILSNFLASHFPPGSHSVGLFQQIFEQAKAWYLEVQGHELALLAFRILDSSISWARPSLVLTSPRNSYLMSMISSRTLLISSITWMKTLSPMHSRNSWIVYELLCCSFSRYLGFLRPSWGPQSVNVRLFLCICRGPYLLFLPCQVVYNRHPL